MLHDTARKRMVCVRPSAKVPAAVLAVLAAVALPQAVHAVGAATGLGSSLGEILLPMHLAIFAAGLLAGPWVGLTAGAAAPVISFALSGMPSITALPFMVVELAGYGLATGLLTRTRMPLTAKVVLAQLIGRGLRALAILLAFYGFSAGLPVASIWTGLLTGLPGIALQCLLLPLTVGYIERRTARHA